VAQIDRRVGEGRTVSLVASSAGASLALHAFAKRKSTIHAVVLLAPALGKADSVAPGIFAINPTFKISMEQLPATLNALTAYDCAKILSVKPRSDRVVPLSDMDIKGAAYLQLPTRGHLWTIVAALTIYSPGLVRFIKSKV